MYAFKPDYSIHPGEYLEDVLSAREIKKNDLSMRLGISVKHLSQILNKQASISSELALHLERALGISANIWNHMNADYNLFEARQNEQKLLREKIQWLKKFPIKDLIKNNFLPNVKNFETQIEKLLEFLGISSPEQWVYYINKNTNFLRSTAFQENIEHITSWLRAGELLAIEQTVEPFNKEILKSNLNELRKLTLLTFNEFITPLKEICLKNGIALVILPEFTNTHVFGASYFHSPHKAVIIMSMRYKTNDHFWFTFFHEIAHIILHSKKEVHIDEPNGTKTDDEMEANKYSENILIPEADFKKFSKNKIFSKNLILNFARKIELHPGIVVGRLQYNKLLHLNKFNELKDRIDFKTEK